jgi:hypothetical protein
LGGDYQKFGFVFDGVSEAAYFDTLDARFGGEANFVHALVLPAPSGTNWSLNVKVPVSWSVFHDFAVERTPTEIVLTIDGVEVARTVQPWSFALPIGVWNDRSPTMLTDRVEVVKVQPLSLSTDPYHVWANGHKEATLTAKVVDPATGLPLSKHPIRIETDSPDCVELRIYDALFGTPIGPWVPAAGGLSYDTNFEGVATILARSTIAKTVKITAEDRTGSPPPGQGPTATQSVEFQRHKVAVIVQGVNTELTACAEPEGVCPEPPSLGLNYSAAIQQLRQALRQVAKLDAEDILWYSYRGGSVGTTDGKWRPAPYGWRDTASEIGGSIRYLGDLLREFSRSNPNTDFHIIGHSQGGLIAFQAIGMTGNLVSPSATAGPSQIVSITTLDGALGGAPLKDAKWLKAKGRLFHPISGGWGPPAMTGSPTCTTRPTIPMIPVATPICARARMPG